MKRPFGLIGLVFLSALAVFFYCYSTVLAVITLIVCVSAVLAAVFIKLFKPSFEHALQVIAASLSVLAAMLSIFLFQNNIVTPVWDNYSGKEISVEGYICDDIAQSGHLTYFTVQSEKIDGKDSDIKILYSTFEDYDVYSFDKIKVKVTPSEVEMKRTLAFRTYLQAYDDNGSLVKTGEKHESLFTLAAELRHVMVRALNCGLSNNAAQLSRAVLLGEKRALSKDVRGMFNATGTSYLIVVSGMHLAIATFFIRLMLKRAKPWFAFAGVLAFVLVYMAVTGFNASVVRAGIMLIVTYLGRTVYRSSDGINSLGIAALILCVPNPFIVGDVGLLLSFAATMGVLLLGSNFSFLLRKKLGLLEIGFIKQELTTKSKLKILLKRALVRLIDLVCVSISATLWITPLTVLFFGKISPLTFLISLFAYPLASAVLLVSMVYVALYSIPVLSLICVPLGFLINGISELLLIVISFSAKIPFAQIRADEPYFYVWIAVTAAFVILGYIIHAKGKYIAFSVFASAVVLITGACFSAVFADESAYFTVFRSGTGYAAAVTKLDNVSFLSSGGAFNSGSVVGDELVRAGSVDNIVVTTDKNKNAALLDYLTDEFDVSNILVYDISCNNDLIPEENVTRFGDNTSFTLALNSDSDVRVYSVGKKTYQYVSSQSVSVLILPVGADIKKLPDELRTADYALLEGKVYSPELLNCNNYIAIKEIKDFPTEVKIIPSREFYRIPLT